MAVNSRSTVILTVCLIFTLMLPGCFGGREINDLEIAIGMGIDRKKDTGDIVLTAQIIKEREMGKSFGGGGGGDSKAFWNVSATGETIFEAARQITHMTGNRLFVSHNQAVIFGKEVAEEGMQKYIDFFLRAHEMRPTTLILIAQDQASDVLNIKPETEKLPVLNMVKIVKSYDFTSHFYKVNMNDFASRLLSGTTAPIAPVVGITRSNDNSVLKVSGLAVFKNGNMSGQLSEAETLGLLWVIGKVEGGLLVVPCPGGKVVFEIMEAESKITPKIKDGKIEFHVRIKAKTSLSEQNSTGNLETIPAFENLQKSQSEVIRQEIMAAFKKSKELNADIFGFGEILHKKYKKEWKIYKDIWDEIYPTVELSIDTETKIQKSDLLKKPVAPKKEE